MNDNFDPAEVRKLSDEAVELEREMIRACMPVIRGRDMRLVMAASLGISAALAQAAKFPPPMYREAVLAMADVVDAMAQELPDGAA